METVKELGSTHFFDRQALDRVHRLSGPPRTLSPPRRLHRPRLWHGEVSHASACGDRDIAVVPHEAIASVYPEPEIEGTPHGVSSYRPLTVQPVL